jgi:hypothetical protein
MLELKDKANASAAYGEDFVAWLDAQAEPAHDRD